jgi:CRISPR-associated protein Cmr3
MNKKTCFITLTPYELFFFGGEQEETADYYLKGNPLPQQTALLGMVRYQILKQNGLLENNVIKDENAAKQWIGSKSFDYRENKQTFGKIDSISSCYIVEQTADGETVDKYLPAPPEFTAELEVTGGNYLLPGYDPKNNYPPRWKSVDNGRYLNVNFYEEIERPGVDKNYTGKTEKDCYFKQVSLKMHRRKDGNTFAFGCYLTVDEDVKIENADVSLGKDNSVFRMKVESAELPQETHNDDANAIVLTCDAFVKNSFLTHCNFAVCDTVPFRCLANKTEKSYNHYNRHKSEEQRIQLLKRGSVFICVDKPIPAILRQIFKFLARIRVFIYLEKSIPAIISALTAETHFRETGYNSFQTIKINITKKTIRK